MVLNVGENPSLIQNDGCFSLSRSLSCSTGWFDQNIIKVSSFLSFSLVSSSFYVLSFFFRRNGRFTCGSLSLNCASVSCTNPVPSVAHSCTGVAVACVAGMWNCCIVHSIQRITSTRLQRQGSGKNVLLLTSENIAYSEN